MALDEAQNLLSQAKNLQFSAKNLSVEGLNQAHRRDRANLRDNGGKLAEQK
jgi:hypothetical protein